MTICSIYRFQAIDVDTKEVETIVAVVKESGGEILRFHESPKGWHLICKPFDTRKVCEMENVSLHRDGYFYIKMIGGEEHGSF